MQPRRPLLTIEVVEKLEAALGLLSDVLRERPELEALDLPYLIRQVREALSAMSGEDADLPLNLLMVKYGWTASQRFHVLARKRGKIAEVLADQELPEGMNLPLPSPLRIEGEGTCISIDARIKKNAKTFAWVSQISRI
jgi:hypothetical protein